MKAFGVYFSEKIIIRGYDVTVMQRAENVFRRVSAKNEFFKKRFYTCFRSFVEKVVSITFLAIVLKFSELFSKFQPQAEKS